MITTTARNYLIYAFGLYVFLHLIPSTIGRFHP